MLPEAHPGNTGNIQQIQLTIRQWVRTWLKLLKVCFAQLTEYSSEYLLFFTFSLLTNRRLSRFRYQGQDTFLFNCGAFYLKTIRMGFLCSCVLFSQGDDNFPFLSQRCGEHDRNSLFSQCEKKKRRKKCWCC